MSWKIYFLFFEVVAIFWSQNPNVLVFWFCSSLEISMLWFCTSLASFSFSSDHQRNIVSILAHLRTHALCTIYDYIINNHLLGACGQITLTLISLGDRNPDLLMINKKTMTSRFQDQRILKLRFKDIIRHRDSKTKTPRHWDFETKTHCNHQKTKKNFPSNFHGTLTFISPLLLPLTLIQLPFLVNKTGKGSSAVTPCIKSEKQSKTLMRFGFDKINKTENVERNAALLRGVTVRPKGKLGQ